jgi:glycosyltransferase involved in cell wall biosynthesis
MIDSILVFTRSTPHHRTGGMETMAWSIAAQWSRSVRDVRIVTTDIPATGTEFTEDGVHVVPLKGTRPGEYSNAWWEQSKAYWDHMPTPPDVVLSVSAGAYAVARDRTKYPRTPFVLQAHGTSAMEISSKLRAHDLRSLATAPKNVLGLVRDLARYRDFDKIVAVGDKVAESLVTRPQTWGVPEDRVALIPNGVRVQDHGFDPYRRAEIRASLGIHDGMTVVASIGRLHVQKRVDRALHAAAALRDQGVSDRFVFLVVGDGPDEERVRGVARDLNLGDMVRFVGRVHRDDVRGYYSAADVALLTTARLEGLPMAVLEGLANGLPCIVPTGSHGASGLDHVVQQCDPADPARLAQVLYTVMPSRGPRGSLLPERFTLEHCAASYLATFGDLIVSTRS